MNLKKKLLLLDLDGTLRETRSGAKFINDPYDQKLIEGVAQKLKSYAQTHSIIGISNQGGVQAGYKSLENCILEQRYTLELCPEMACIYFCPDDGQKCYIVSLHKVYVEDWSSATNTNPWGCFRKPQPGMLNKAILDIARYWPTAPRTSSQIAKLEEILYVGDRPEDELAAMNAQVSFIWADKWRVE